MNLPNRMPLLQLRFRTKAEADASAETMMLMMQMLSGTVDLHIRQLPTVAVRDRMLGDGDFIASAASEFLVLPPRRGTTPAKHMTNSDVVELPIRFPAQPQIMLDLETLGRGAGCPVLSIGAVELTPQGLGAEFYANLEVAPQVEAGLEVDAETEAWWAAQAPEARAALTSDVRHPLDALADFADWLRPYGDNVCIWGNGAAFDNAIMGSVYRALNVKQPWSFWNDRCYRTLKSRATWLKAKKPTLAHHALEDAKAQARHAIRIMNELDLW